MFYATPSAKEKLYQLGKDIPEIKLKQTVVKLQSTATEDVEEKLQRPVAEFPLAFALVPWGHHREILSKPTNETEILKETMISVIRLSGCSHTSKIRTDSITSSARASVSGMVYSRFFLKFL